MATNSPNPFVLGDALLTIGTDSYQAAVSSAAITTVTSSADFNGMAPGANYSFPTSTKRTLDITALQDWTPTGLSRYLWDHAGETVNVTFEPVNGAEGFTAVVTLVEPSAGGANESVATFSVSLPIKGRPVLVPAV
jgi:hypothetical protein